jgi:hypothetical protein
VSDIKHMKLFVRGGREELGLRLTAIAGDNQMALVEADQPTERAEAVEEVRMPRVAPILLKMGDEGRDQHDVRSPPPVTW